MPNNDQDLNDMIEKLERKIGIIGNVNEFIEKVDKIQTYENEIVNLKNQILLKDQLISRL